MEPNTNNMVMPVAPMGYGGYGFPFGGMGGFGGMDMFGGNGWWIILLFLVLGRGFGGGFGGGYGMGGGAPIIINNSDDDNNGGSRGYNAVQRGFDQAAIMSGINGVQSAVTTGFGNVQTSLCSGFAGVNATVNGAQNAIAQQLYANQLADLERSFAAQTANTQGMTALQSQLAQCCCDNRLATANLTATVLQENCADRAALENGVRDILTNQNANTQRLLDQMCNDKIDAKNEKIADLERQLTMANLAASQTAQNAFIAQTVNGAIDANYQRFKDCPVGTVPVYGSQPIFTCPQTASGCGCTGGFVA